MTNTLAALGIALILLAIPFGLMLAPLAIGMILVVVAYRRLGHGLDPVSAVPS